MKMSGGLTITSSLSGTCKNADEHVLDWYGQGQKHAEWRDKVLRDLTSKFLDQALSKKIRIRNGDVYLNMHTRIDKNAKAYRTTHKSGPKWDDVVRRVTYDLDRQVVIQDIRVKDQPIGYDWHAELPKGVTNISTRLYW